METNDIIKHFDKATEELKTEFLKQTTETKRHFDVVAEDLGKQISAVAEGVLSVDAKLEALASKEDVVALESRVAALEASQA